MKYNFISCIFWLFGAVFVVVASEEKVEVPYYARKAQDAHYMRLQDVQFSRPHNDFEASIKSSWNPSVDEIRKFSDKIDSIAGQSDTTHGYDKADLDDFQFFEDDRKNYYEGKAKGKKPKNSYTIEDLDDFVDKGSPDSYTFSQEQKEKISGIYQSFIEEGYDDTIENLLAAIKSAKNEKHIAMLKVVALYLLELVCAVGVFDFLGYCMNLLLREQKLTKLQKARIKQEKLDYKVLYWLNKLEAMKQQLHLDTQVKYTMLLQSYIDGITKVADLEKISEDQLVKFLSALRGLKRESELSFHRMQQEEVQKGIKADSEDTYAMEKIMQESRELYERLFSIFQVKKAGEKKKGVDLSKNAFVS